MKKLVMALVAAGAWSLLSAAATANCYRSFVQVVRVTVVPGTAASVIYYRDNALTNYYWLCTTTDANLLSAALTAQNGLTRASITGDAASCPATSDANGARSAGNCVYVAVNP